MKGFFYKKKKQHTPRGIQNRDHPTNEDIRDHHNKKKHQTPCGPQKLNKNPHWKTLCAPHQQTNPIKGPQISAIII